MSLDLRKKYQGRWEISPKIAIKDSYALSLVYTPGVGRVSMEIAENQEKSFELTNRANSVAVITTGSYSKIPLVEAKAVLYNKLAGIDAYPLVLDTSNVNEIAEILINLAPTFAGFVLTEMQEDTKSQIQELLQKADCELRLEDGESPSGMPFKASNQGFNLPVIFDSMDDKKTSMLLRSLLGEIPEESFELPKAEDKLSLSEKSVDLHKRAKGVIKTNYKISIENVIDGKVYCEQMTQEEAIKSQTDVPESCIDYSIMGVNNFSEMLFKASSQASEEINLNPDSAYELTPKGNLVAVISDGSAVLGLGNIGAEAAMPVMEGKSSLFKTLGGIDAMPICLKTQDTEELINIISKLSPILGGINLEDISAPRCFEIEKTLIEKLDIPVFHDDQHGTAVVVLAGFINALKLTGKNVKEIKVVVNGAGAGAIAVSKLLISYGVKNLILCDRTGAIFDGRIEGMNPFKQEMAEITNPNKEKCQLKDVIKNADFFIGLSAANVVNQEMIKSMAKKAVVFALANPVPEIMPEDALEAGAFIVATGRSDFKNQVNNSLAFPGIFRGVLDVRAEKITDEMKISAAYSIASLITENELNSEYIIPHALDLRVPPAVAKAVAQTAINTNMARVKTSPDLIFERTKNYFIEGFLQ